MRLKFAPRLIAGTALALIVALLPIGAAQAETAGAKAGEAAQFDPKVADTVSGAFLAARTAETDRDFKNAIALYKRALAFEPGDVDMKQRLMLALFMNGQFDEGVKLANELKNDPGVQRITAIARGLDAIRNREFNTAEKVLEYKGANDLDRLTNALLVAWARFGAGKSREALSMVEKLSGPKWYGIFKSYNAGAIAAASGNIDAARRNFNEAVTDREGGAMAPDTFIRAVMALATLEANQGNKQKALDTISAGDQLINNYTPFKHMRQQIEGAGLGAPGAMTAAEGASGVLFSVGGALNRQGAEDTVALYLQLSQALDPKAADTLVLLGNLAESTNQTDRAIEFYSRVPADSPMRRASELQLGLTLAQAGKVEEAKAHLKGLIDSDPTDIRSYLAYGSVLSDAKEYALMAENYDKAAEQLGQTAPPSSWSVFFQRGIAYERLKQWDKAEPNFRKALELNPDQPQVLNYLGYSWVDMNRNLEEGLDMIRKAVELRPDDGYIVDSLGWAYYRLNRFEDAVTELERAIELKAGDATINDHLGDAYWRVGRRLEAVYQWQRALASKPEDSERPKIEAKIRAGLPESEADAGKANAAAPGEPAVVPADKKS